MVEEPLERKRNLGSRIGNKQGMYVLAAAPYNVYMASPGVRHKRLGVNCGAAPQKHGLMKALSSCFNGVLIT